VDSSATFLEVASAKPTTSGYKTLRFAVFDRKVTQWGEAPSERLWPPKVLLSHRIPDQSRAELACG
jgi:hypothetical protein